MSLLALPQLTVSGVPRALGAAQGEALREKIQSFVAMRLAAADKYMRERGRRSGLDALREAGAKSAKVHGYWDPDGYAEHEGIASGANVDALELYTVTNMTDMRDVVLLGAASGPPLGGTAGGENGNPEGCSSVLVPASHGRAGQPLAGQTWDLNPEDLEYVVAVHRMPSQGPETWAITCTGCLTIMGMNAAGVAVGTTNVKTYGAEPGVGYLGVLHRAIRARRATEASESVRTAPHAAAHTYWVADAETQVEWEASPNGQYKRTVSAGPVVRTNHCLASTHLQLEGEVPSASSRARFDRLEGLLATGDLDVERLKAAFADRSDGVNSVSRYPEDRQGTATNAVFIADLAGRRAFACRGPADRGEWTELKFAGN